MSVELRIPTGGSYALTEQFRELGERVAFPDLNLHKVEMDGMKGYEFKLRNPWYTEFPVSCAEDMEVGINGYAVQKGKIFFVIRDQAVPFKYAKNLYELQWGLGEVAQVRMLDGQLQAVVKEANDVEIKFLLRTAFEGYHLPNNRIEYEFKRNMGVI
ncbi:MAG TPA: hypothetical protein GXX75_16725 [Clostridiales bacterium]|nr:hypothetical protein [Clostridiales bacterium]